MTTQTRNRRRGVWLRSAIAAAAVLGIGGAITTAAWSNHVTFEADAIAVSLDGRAVDGNGLVLNDLIFQYKGETLQRTVEIKNKSNVNVALSAQHPDFYAHDISIVMPNTSFVLAPGEAREFQLGFKAGANTPNNLGNAPVPLTMTWSAAKA